MKSGPARGQANRHETEARSHNTSGGKNAAALAPPVYGIDFVDSAMQGIAKVQCIGKLPEEEDRQPLQGKFDAASVQLRESSPRSAPNRTGMPDSLKAGIESLSAWTCPTCG